MTQYFEGGLRKMQPRLDDEVQYVLPVADQKLWLNPHIGNTISIRFPGVIECICCGRRTKKSFNQGYCYPCFRDLARCDRCIVSPQLCHFHLGTCRELDWGQAHCMQSHLVYLANSSGIKVGITRKENIPERWIDQGAVQALPLMEVSTRRQSGFLEDLIRQQVPDKTNWRTMLKGNIVPLDLLAEKERLLAIFAEQLEELALDEVFAQQPFRVIEQARPVSITYPVLVWPQKVVALSLDRQPQVRGKLMGIKGQYLILDCGVFNVRKHAGYQVTIAL